jgi:aryl-alcohol dehydrogenase-like predicted oxidoreductase
MKTKRERTTCTTLPGGTFKLADDLILTRVGYGAMQLAGPHVFGPPADRDGALAVLREVVSLGITHIDTSDFYGPHITNRLIREALHPYPEQLRIVTKVGARRDAEGNWPKALAPDELRQAVRDNLANLGLDTLDVVNLRVGGFEAPEPGSIAEPFSVLAEMQQEGLIKHLGVSTVNAEQIAEAQSIAPAAASRISTISLTGRMIRLSARLPNKELLMCRTSRLEVFHRCNPIRCPELLPVWILLQWRSPWRGCCNAHLTFCSFPERHLLSI